MVLREQPTEHSIAFELDVVELVEPDTLLFVKKGDVSMVARIMRDVGERGDGATVHLELPPEQLHFFETGSRACRRPDHRVEGRSTAQEVAPSQRA